MFRLPHINNRGFTLLETFVAVTILVIAVIGPLAMLVRGITDGNYARNEVTAFYIAQEGLELVINHRDAMPLSDPLDSTYPWLAPDLTSCMTATGCDIDVEDGVVTSCGGEGCPLFKFADGSMSEADFKRQIKIIKRENQLDVAAGNVNFSPGPHTLYNQAEVIVTVTWNNKKAPRTLVLKDVIYSN